MSSYSRIILILSFIFVFYGCAGSLSTVKKETRKYDTLILVALDYELTHQYYNSAEAYKLLYDETSDVQYLQKAIANTSIAKNFQGLYDLTKNNLNKYPTLNEKYYRLAILASLQLKKYDEASILAKELLEKYNNPTNYDVMGNVYFEQDNYKEASKYFESAYASNQKANTLISLVDVLYSYLNEKKKAVSYLETYLLTYGCNELVCNKLITIYREEQNTDGMISILKRAYKEYKNPKMKYTILSILMAVLEQKDINKAILFLEENKVDDVKLFTLYEKSRNFKKALKLARKLYKQTKNKEILGQMAILQFEIAQEEKNTKDKMKHIIANFELALKVSKNPNYKNYYGYLLIDYDIDIKKGLKLVNEALESVPTNWAYMDSVAWGYYKLNDCKQAKKYMKKIVNQIGLDNSEIKEHWNKIQECKK